MIDEPPRRATSDCPHFHRHPPPTNCSIQSVLRAQVRSADRCEAELFGVERGASPQAIRRRLGALEFENHGAKITIPPLRQRPDEICSFASFFVEQFNRQYQRRADLCPDTVATLRDHFLAREPARARGNGASSRGQRNSPGLRIERIACVEGPARQHSAHVCTLSWKLPISMEVSGSVRDFTVDPELPTQPVFCAVGCTEHRQKFSVQDSLHQAPFLCERALVRRLPS